MYFVCVFVFRPVCLNTIIGAISRNVVIVK